MSAPRQRSIALVTMGAVASLAIGLARAQPARDDRALYVAYGCYQCHGYEGQGGEALRIAPTAYPLEAFAARVRKPSNEMPAYAPEVLSDADLEAIYRYVRSRPEPTAEIVLR